MCGSESCKTLYIYWPFQQRCKLQVGMTKKKVITVHPNCVQYHKYILAYYESLTITVVDTLPTCMWHGVEFPDVGYWWLLSGNLGTNSKSWN